MTIERYESDKYKFSHWTLKELHEWNKRGLLPWHETQDIEATCAFFGALDVLSWFQPDVLTLVHGTAGCGLSLSSARAWPGCSKKHRPMPLTTGMDAQDVIQGGTHRLSKALVEVDETYSPKIIVVLTNCCSYIIGDDVAGTVQNIARELKANVLTLEVAGCTGSGFRKGSDAALDLLIKHVAGTQTNREPVAGALPSVNVFTKRVSGRPAELADVEEVKRLLGKINVEVNTVVRLGTTLEQLAALPRARANATLCFTFGKGPLESLRNVLGQPFAPMTFPLGIEGTLAWVDQVARLLNVENTLPNDPEVREARRKMERLRDKVAGRQAYIWQPGEKGLATAVFASELGMKPVLYGMSYYLEQQLRPTIEMLLERGYEFDLVLAGKYKLLEKAAEIDLEQRPLVFMPKKFWLGECPKVTFNFFTDALMGLKGVETLIAEIDDALDMAEKKDYRLFNRYVETLYKAVDWEVGEDEHIIKNINHHDLKWKRWNVR